MKSIFLKSGRIGSLIMALSIMIVSCTKESQDLYNYEESPDVNYLEIIKYLELDTSSAIDMGDYFLVEGDIMLSKEQLFQERNISTRQVRDQNTVSFAYRYNMKVRIDSSIPTAWHATIQQALNAWNSGGSVYLKIVTTSNQDILIKKGNIEYAYAAASPPSSNGAPGSEIVISDLFYSLSANKQQLVIVHELGHTLGFRHTNWSADPNKNGTYIAIAGTPNSGTNPDPNSVMNWDIAFNSQSWSGFSSYDRIAIGKLYANPYTGLLSGPGETVVGASNTYSNVPLIVVGSNIRVEWQNYNGKGEKEGFIENPSGLSNTIIFQKRGAYQLYCSFYDNNNGGRMLGQKWLEVLVY